MGQHNNFKNTKGQALVVVISILGLLFVVGVAFFSLSQAERTASLRHLDSLRARYITEAGVAYALKVLKLDRQTNLIDSLEDATFKHFYGEEVDLNNDGKAEGRWFNIADIQGNPYGRFGIEISDEAAKINLNTSPVQALEQLFSQLGIDSSKINILLSRRPFNAIEQIGPILEKKEFALAKNFLTVYSRDWEVDLERKRRTYLSSSSAQVLLEGFLGAGIKDPYQKAANLKDASDSDLVQTHLDKFAKNDIMPTGLQVAGSWVKAGNFYEAPAGGSAGKFIWSNLPVEDGDYFCFLYGSEDTDVIGEVYLDGEENSSELLLSGESLAKKIKVNAGTFTLNIKPAKDKTSRFSRVELASPSPEKGLQRKVITGTEALVINELMVKPWREILIDNPAELSPGQSFSYTFTQQKAGDYYVVVKAKKQGGIVGDVSINGQTGNNLYDGEYFPYAVNVGSSGNIIVEIKNNSLGVATFKGIRILQQPDGEFIEVLNLSSQEIDLSNFSFEVYSAAGELITGWPARIPEDTKIRPYQYLVFSVDNDDASPSPDRLKNNRICFKNIWGFNSIGLIFDEYLDSIDKSFDLLPDAGAIVILKDDLLRQIDGVEYQDSQVKDFISLERGDPTAKTDADEDGLFDGWYASESEDGATPTHVNENGGMYTRDESGASVKHNPSEIVVFNRKLSGLAEAQQLSTGKNWEKFTLLDVSRMADHFASEALGLALLGHYKAGEFNEKDGAFESLHKGDTGVWEFTKVASGTYLLSILSDKLAAEGEEIKVAYKTDDKEEFKDFSSLLFTQGSAFYGRIELKEENLTLQLKIINDSEERLVLKQIQLEPIDSVRGRININTASPEALRSILISDELTQTILNNRPIGVKDNRNLGIGELFLLDPRFLNLHNYLTVKSDVYEINCRGEYYLQGKTLAYQTIRTVLERGE